MTTDVASTYDLRAKYNHFNELCFGGELPPIPLKFALLKQKAGVCKCKFHDRPEDRRLPKRIRVKRGTMVPGSLNIAIDKTFLRTEQEIDATLIHEMIHAWFMSKGDLAENHGPRFEEMRRRLERVVGFKIPKTENIETLEFADLVLKRCIVLVREKPDGRYSYAIANPTSYFKIARALNDDWVRRGAPNEVLKIYDIKSVVWTQQSMLLPMQRISSLSSIKFYFPNKPELIADLRLNGKLLSDIPALAR